MTILNKDQIEIEIKEYKLNKKINILFPDETWAKHHFTKSDYIIDNF